MHILVEDSVLPVTPVLQFTVEFLGGHVGRHAMTVGLDREGCVINGLPTLCES